MFCSYRAWYEVKGEEFKSCPRCGNGMFVWRGGVMLIEQLPRPSKLAIKTIT